MPILTSDYFLLPLYLVYLMSIITHKEDVVKIRRVGYFVTMCHIFVVWFVLYYVSDVYTDICGRIRLVDCAREWYIAWKTGNVKFEL
jgi:hypothetical protein